MSGPLIPVILSGGAGTRLWPLSRELYPKQLLPLCSDRTLLQETALRIEAAPIVVCNQEHRFIVAEQIREIGIEAQRIVIEPIGRNTLPAITIAALMNEATPDALLLVMPSDHSILDHAAFQDGVARAVGLAESGHLVTFGIHPERAETGYGYIRRGVATGGGFTVDRFVEKPDAETAAGYLASGGYDWNSGIFLFPVGVFLAEVERLSPDLLAGCRRALAEGSADLFFFRLGEAAFAAVPSQSVDYGVMERTDKAAVVPVRMGWSDIGSWSALWRETPQDDHGNAVIGDGVVLNSQGCYVRAEHGLVAAVGVRDLVIVATGDAVLVADKSADQDVKKIVEILKTRQRPEATQGLRVWRPWGWFETVEEGPRFKVKQLQVEPGAKLSLQKHWHRSEHWVVVTGTAIVTRDGSDFILRENESTFIPAGTPHRLENPGKVPLRLIEVQSGEYVGEDDIVRLEDVYGR